MVMKVIFGVFAVLLVGIYLIAPLIKLKEIDLAVILIAGFAMVVVDLWQSLKSKED